LIGYDLSTQKRYAFYGSPCLLQSCFDMYLYVLSYVIYDYKVMGKSNQNCE